MFGWEPPLESVPQPVTVAVLPAKEEEEEVGRHTCTLLIGCQISKRIIKTRYMVYLNHMDQHKSTGYNIMIR